MGKPKIDEKPSESKFSYVKMVSKSIVSRSGDFNKVLDFFDNHSKNLSFIQCVSIKLNLPPGLVLMFFTILVVLFFISRIGGSIVCDAVGFLYPSYKSFKVLKQSKQLSSQARNPESAHKLSDGNDKSKDEQLARDLELNKRQLIYWTKYWVVFSLGFIFNYFANKFLYWFPFFYVIKLFFIILLLHPKLQGAELIYNLFISPILNKYESIIDNTVATIEKTTDQLTRYGVEKLSGTIKDYTPTQPLNLE